MSLLRHAMRLLLGRRLPITAGTIQVQGVDGEIVVRRDRWGVPQIDASSESDGWFGLGFCHAQDRPFQLEATLRVVRGTLSELVGPDGLGVDRLSRRIGFARAAARQLDVASAHSRTMLAAYTRGVNAGLARGVTARPHELVLLRAGLTPWTAADALGYVKLTSFLLATNWDVELARLKILSQDGPEALAALDPAYPDWQPVIMPPGAQARPAVDYLTEEIGAFLAVTGGGGGSNNWAVAAPRSATGRPIFANDPHLSAALPPHWYLCRIRTPAWSVAGASFIGAPNVAVGHNGFAAWGVTVGMTDTTDLFLEEIGPDGRSVRQGNGFVPCELIRERIAVRGRGPEIEEVLIGPRGPIISPLLGETPTALSLRAVWLDPLPIEGLLRVQEARGFDQFHHLMAHWPELPLNMAYADSSGTIGWQLIGTAPRRRRGHGAIPLPGWEAGAGWEPEHLPHEELPYLRDPETGYVATANNRTMPEGEGPFLTVDWIDGYRAARIDEELEGRTDWDLPRTSALQLDVRCIPWREMRDVVLALRPEDGAATEGLRLLAGWDGRLTPDSAAASIFELFVAELTRRVVQGRAPRSWRWAMGAGFHELVQHNTFGGRRVGHLVRLLREQPEGWVYPSWERAMEAALSAAVTHLRQEYGDDRLRWAWGAIRPLVLEHPLSRRKPLDRIFNLGPFPWGGDSNTPSQAAVTPLSPTENPLFIASLRFVADVGRWDDARFALPGGQSGNPLSSHYADQLPLWRRGEGIPIPWSEEAVKAATMETLRLLPTHSHGGSGKGS